ncbi:N-acetylmuramoyl-L-alanine amidase [Serratia microhaemolytica]|uniref:N-acetylmuramoyl-L-alanine amidase n=1 Tax=Serratia microhaemolytica TaxID=2675110 RepID=UPI000FDEAADC|nr:N-acetylmuramoyl-L-alanine amidase [Serratia microhaemolytica]
MISRITFAVMAVMVSCCPLAVSAASLVDIKVTNAERAATVLFGFNSMPTYSAFPLRKPERIVLDVEPGDVVAKLPLSFNGRSLIRKIRTSHPKDEQSVRLVFELAQAVKTDISLQKQDNGYRLIFKLAAEGNRTGLSAEPQSSHELPALLVNKREPQQSANHQETATVASSLLAKKPGSLLGMEEALISNHYLTDGFEPLVVVGIDAGHGGQDPGAIGAHGLLEKEVTLAIAHRLRVLLEDDPMFKPVMTRTGDYFVSVRERSDVARQQGANVLVSIHADALSVGSAKGASVWVLSSRRASDELGNWLEKHEKQSELLGGAGELLADGNSDPYLSQALLELQFGHSQRVGYEVASALLPQLEQIGDLHKNVPQHASLGVLRSPDIPSVLVETGFITNEAEERLLNSDLHQDKLAQAIYFGLREYFLSHPLQIEPQIQRPLQNLVQTNQLTSSRPKTAKLRRHKVSRGDTLSSIAARYGVSVVEIKRLNKLKSDVAPLDRMLTIPSA